MAQIKAQDIDWLSRAKELGAILLKLPSAPLGGLLAPPQALTIDDNHRKLLEVLRDQIALHLAYRLHVTHKLRPKGKGRMLIPESSEPGELISLYADIAQLGVGLNGVDEDALRAHDALCQVLRDGFVCRDWLVWLPLWVTSIGGPTVSQRAKKIGSRKRVRPSGQELREAAIARKRRFPHESWKERLDQLQGDGLVLSWNLVEILWQGTDDDEPRRTKSSTFKTWK